MRNILSSWGGYIVRLVIAFFFVPFIASEFGDARYGVWVIVFQTINYFSLLDIGLSSALTRYVSRYLSERDFGRISRTLSTSNVLYLIIGSLIFAGVYLFVELFFHYFKISDPAMVEEGKQALLVLGAFMAFNSYLLPFGNSFAGFQRQDINRFLAVCENIILVIIMVWLIRRGHGLVALALAILSISVLKHIAGIVWLKRLYREVRFSLKDVSAETARTLMGYSKVSFGITIGWLIIFNTDTFLLGMLSSSAAAGIYNPAAQLMLYLRNTVNAIGIPLTPAVSHVDAAGRAEQVRSIYHRGIKYITYLSVLFTVGVVVYAKPFVNLWLPPEFEQTAQVMIILAFGSAFFLPQIIGNSVLFGIGQHQYILRTLIFEALGKILIAIFLVPKHGLWGMAVANTIPQVILYSTLYPWFISRALGISLRTIALTGLRSGALATVVTIPAVLIASRILPPVTWGAFAVNVLVVVGIAAVPGYLLLERGDRDKLIGFLKKS
jgi:O-antigen/teichoic acid export membrane protein